MATERIPPDGYWLARIAYRPPDGVNSTRIVCLLRPEDVALGWAATPDQPSVVVAVAWPEYPWKTDSCRIVPDPCWVRGFQRWFPDYCPQQILFAPADVDSFGVADIFTYLESRLPPPAKAEQGEGTGGAGSAPEQPEIPHGTAREAIVRQLKPAVRKAYLAYQYAETMKGRRLEDREAYEWLKENGIDQGKGDLGELADYELPDSLDTFRRYLTTARKPLGESKYTRRGGRKHGGSIAQGNAIEYQNGDKNKPSRM